MLTPTLLVFLLSLPSTHARFPWSSWSTDVRRYVLTTSYASADCSGQPVMLDMRAVSNDRSADDDNTVCLEQVKCISSSTTESAPLKQHTYARRECMTIRVDDPPSQGDHADAVTSAESAIRSLVARAFGSQPMFLTMTFGDVSAGCMGEPMHVLAIIADGRCVSTEREIVRGVAGESSGTSSDSTDNRIVISSQKATRDLEGNIAQSLYAGAGCLETDHRWTNKIQASMLVYRHCVGGQLAFWGAEHADERSFPVLLSVAIVALGGLTVLAVAGTILRAVYRRSAASVYGKLYMHR